MWVRAETRRTQAPQVTPLPLYLCMWCKRWKPLTELLFEESDPNVVRLECFDLKDCEKRRKKPQLATGNSRKKKRKGKR